MEVSKSSWMHEAPAFPWWAYGTVVPMETATSALMNVRKEQMVKLLKTWIQQLWNKNSVRVSTLTSSWLSSFDSDPSPESLCLCYWGRCWWWRWRNHDGASGTLVSQACILPRSSLQHNPVMKAQKYIKLADSLYISGCINWWKISQSHISPKNVSCCSCDNRPYKRFLEFQFLGK